MMDVSHCTTFIALLQPLNVLSLLLIWLNCSLVVDWKEEVKLTLEWYHFHPLIYTGTPLIVCHILGRSSKMMVECKGLWVETSLASGDSIRGWS